MSLDILVNGELVKTVPGTVLGVSLNTAEGEKAAVKIPADGYRQIELVTREISPGGARHLSQVEEAQRRENRRLGAGLPDPLARRANVNLTRQNPGIGTLVESDSNVDDVRFAGDPDAPPPVDPNTGEALEGEALEKHNKALEEIDKKRGTQEDADEGIYVGTELSGSERAALESVSEEDTSKSRNLNLRARAPGASLDEPSAVTESNKEKDVTDPDYVPTANPPADDVAGGADPGDDVGGTAVKDAGKTQ